MRCIRTVSLRSINISKESSVAQVNISVAWMARRVLHSECFQDTRCSSRVGCDIIIIFFIFFDKTVQAKGPDSQRHKSSLTEGPFCRRRALEAAAAKIGMAGARF